MEYTEFYFGNDYLYAKIELTVQIPFDFFENYCSPLFMQFFFLNRRCGYLTKEAKILWMLQVVMDTVNRKDAQWVKN